MIKDTGAPENEGKVMLYSFGKKIFDKLNDLMNPEFEDETPVNPFDFWEGANFKLKIRQVEGYANYDRSEFEEPEALFDGDEDKLKEVYDQLHSLEELIAPDQFKSYQELEAKMHKVLGLSGGATYSADDTAEKMVDEDLDMSKLGKEEAEPEQTASEAKSTSASTDDDDDDLSFFKSLAED